MTAQPRSGKIAHDAVPWYRSNLKQFAFVQADAEQSAGSPVDIRYPFRFGRSAVSISSRANGAWGEHHAGEGSEIPEIVLRRVASHLAQRTPGGAGISTLPRVGKIGFCVGFPTLEPAGYLGVCWIGTVSCEWRLT